MWIEMLTVVSECFERMLVRLWLMESLGFSIMFEGESCREGLFEKEAIWYGP